MSQGKWNYPFLEPSFNLSGTDKPYLHELEKVAEKPVIFIQGLHRSGTTFLLNALCDLYRATSTSVYHIAFYRHLLRAEKEGHADGYQRQISEYFRRHGLVDRRIDAVPVSAESLDEYGFILDRLHVPRTTTWLVREILAKLSYLDPAAPFVLLKDPVYFPCCALLRAAVPRARFIFIHRDPRQVLRSWYRAQRTHLSFHARDPYMALLRGEKPGAFSTFLAYVRPVGKRHTGEACAAHIRSQIRDYLRELPRWPTACHIDVRYEDLLEETETTLGKIVDFIGIEPAESLTTVRPRPRPASALPAEIAGMADSLVEGLSRMGYSWTNH